MEYYNEFVQDSLPPKGFSDPAPFGMLEIYREKVASGGGVLVYRDAESGKLADAGDVYVGKDDEFEYRIRAEYLLMLSALYGLPALPEDAHVLITSWNHAASSMFLVSDVDKMLEWCSGNVWPDDDDCEPVDIDEKPAKDVLLAGLFSLDESAAAYLPVSEVKAFLQARYVTKLEGRE